jgi:hypothetical protein
MWILKRISQERPHILKLSGRLESKDLVDLQRQIDLETAKEVFTLDLSDLRIVDVEVVRFLADCEASGAVFLNCAPYIREWIKTNKSTDTTTERRTN